ncbi:serine palmitoyltransferase [Lactarius pseudohatsudake]|nr:serine palmitoyltransferase [Lactarius pseudohatsudake]
MAQPSALKPLFAFLSYAFIQAEFFFYNIPGSHVIASYVKSSQNYPGRTVLGILLALFAIRTLLQSPPHRQRKKEFYAEVRNLVDEWTTEPLDPLLTLEEQSNLALVPVVFSTVGPRPKLANTGKQVLNLASDNFTGLADNETIKARTIETLRKYCFGIHVAPGSYRINEVQMYLERDIANFLGTEASILYSHGFSTMPCMISAFATHGDVIVADRGINYAIQKGLQLSRSTVRWFDHNDLKSLEDVLLTRFIVTEGIFKKDGAMVDLPKLIELKHKYKYRLILDESISFGTVGRTGRGLTELYNVPATQIDMIVGSLANDLNSSGGFCAGSPFPVGPVVSASVGINILRNTPSILRKLQANVRAIRAILDQAPSFVITGEERLLRDIVVEALAQDARPSIRLAVTSALSLRECRRAAGVIKAAVVKVLMKGE